MGLREKSIKAEAPESSARWRALVLLSVAELLGMSLWFSASAVVPALRTEWNLSDSSVGWLTIAVQIGFVCGTLLSAFLNLPDVIPVRFLFAVSALAGALANAAFGAYAHSASTGIVLRFLTGMFLAGVYPPGMKIMATWFQRSRGMALGVLIGALTLGKASPYLVNAIGSSNWRQNILFISLLAIGGGLIVLLFVEDGPHAMPAARFNWKQAIVVFRNRGVRLASFGYFGHMWELYAMWAWIGVFLNASFALSLPPESAQVDARLAAFATIGAGALGCVAAGLVADRIGRTTVTIIAMAVSGSCAAGVGLLYGGVPSLLVAVCLIWGISIVADSAQFSASIAELADPARVGTMLTVQTALGFTLTLVTIHLLPYFVDAVGWRHAFVPLAIGPAVGVWAMVRLRLHPASVRLAGGRR